MVRNICDKLNLNPEIFPDILIKDTLACGKSIQNWFQKILLGSKMSFCQKEYFCSTTASLLLLSEFFWPFSLAFKSN